MVREYDIYFVMALFTLLCSVPIISLYYTNKRLHATVERQQDTINRLINHEAVTYKETGEKPPKPNTEFFSAWGGRTMDIKDLE